MHSVVNLRPILAMWLAWTLYWLILAATAKRTQRRESLGSRLSHVLPLLLGVYLIVWPRLPVPWISQQLLPYAFPRYQLAIVLVALGLGFTVWARVHLGRNWSGSVTQKEGHELVRSGPIPARATRSHTGLLVALVGSAVAEAVTRRDRRAHRHRRLRAQAAHRGGYMGAVSGTYERYAAEVRPRPSRSSAICTALSAQRLSS